MSATSSGGNGAPAIQPRIDWPARASARTSATSRSFIASSIRDARPLCCMNSRKASDVVAKPPGTRMPAAESSPIISPSDAFLPPTCARSRMRKRSNGMTRTGSAMQDFL